MADHNRPGSVTHRARGGGQLPNAMARGILPGMTEQIPQDDYADSVEAHLLADHVAGGETLVDACRTYGANYRMVFKRIQQSERFREMMEEARLAGYEEIASNIRKVTHQVPGFSSGDVKRDKLIAEMDLKLLSKWHPHKYGEKIQVEQKTATVAIPVSDDPIAAQRAYELLMKGGG